MITDVAPLADFTLADFTLPAELEAHDPPEARGIPRDGVRLLVSRSAAGQVSHHGFGDLPDLLLPGDLLRQINIPSAALKRRSAFRQISLTPVGRSAALLIGSVASVGAFLLTVTASTRRPVRLSFAKMPTADELREAILLRITDDRYHNDVHGKPEWRKHMTLRLAEDIRSELADAGEPMGSP